MPGKKDFVNVKINGKKTKIQKRQIYSTIYETYLEFEEKNPDLKIGFSKFAELRQKHIVLPGASGIHNVCVCTYHQNPKLMIANSEINKCSEFKILGGEGFTGEIKYSHLLTHLMCTPPTDKCWLGECDLCVDTSE